MPTSLTKIRLPETLTKPLPQTIAIAMVTMTLAIALNAQTREAQRIDEIRDALLRLPYYGVFDALSFSYDKGRVVLEGYAYRPSLKSDAERAVKRVPGVDEVVNKIVELPPGSNDDELRWRTFYAIYTNAFLSRYAPGGGLLWGHRHEIRRDMSLGLQPIGNYPIHIVVERGRITLLGVVDNAADRTAAELAARGVPGSFGVDNKLMVETEK
jgi:hyperosmotically inducible protein